METPRRRPRRPRRHRPRHRHRHPGRHVEQPRSAATRTPPARSAAWRSSSRRSPKASASSPSSSASWPSSSSSRERTWSAERVDLFAVAGEIAARRRPPRPPTGGGGFTINLFWVIVAALNFLLFLALIWAFAFKPDRRGCSPTAGRGSSRASRTRSGPAARSSARPRPRPTEIAAARREAREILDRAQRVAQETREADIAATREELERMRVRAAAEIEAEKGRAIADLRAEVADLALGGRRSGRRRDDDRRAPAPPRRGVPAPKPARPRRLNGLMARPTTAARRYAEAAFEIARRDGTLDAWRDDLAPRGRHRRRPDGLPRRGQPGRSRSRPGAQVIAMLLADRISPAGPQPASSSSPSAAGSPPSRRSPREYTRLLDRERGVVAATVTSAAAAQRRRARRDRRPRPGDDRRRGRAHGRPSTPRSSAGLTVRDRRPPHRCQRAGTPGAAPRPHRRRSSLTRRPRRAGRPPARRATERRTAWPSDPTRSSASSSPRSTSFDATAETRNVGTVVEVGDGIAQVYGLAGALASELLEFPGGVMGMALNLEEETVGAVILGDATAIKEGDIVKTTGRVVEVPVGPGAPGPGRGPAGPPARRQGPDRRDEDPPGGADRPRRHRPQGGRHARSRPASRRSTPSSRSAAASAS